MFERNRFVDLGYKTYEDMSDEELQSQYDNIISRWDSFLQQNDKELQLEKDYYVHRRNLFEVIRRCDKRILYFYIFHGLREENEYKEIAVMAFWINTLKPFMVINEKSKIFSCPNEMFSLYLILTAICGAYESKFPGQKFKYPSEARIKDILYDFKYCSLSREAMIAFVETLADTYGVGISYILDKQNNKKGDS